jgi:hypothetical protein
MRQVGIRLAQKWIFEVQAPCQDLRSLVAVLGERAREALNFISHPFEIVDSELSARTHAAARVMDDVER